MKAVLALAPYPETAPSTRFRLVELQGALEELGVRMDIHPFVSAAAYRELKRGGAFLRRGATLVAAFEALRGILDRAMAYDVVVVQRGIGLMFDGSLLDALVRRGTPLLYDFDDAVFLRQEGGRPWLEAVRRPEETTARFCRAADVVLAGNAYLADFARDARGERPDRVRVLPSVVNTRRYVPGEGAGGGLPTLGWVGSDSTVPYLETLAPALRRLAERRPHRLVVVAGDRRPDMPGVPYDFVPWKDRDEVSHFQELDVGLYPLPDTPWSQGKCGFKAIQYLACGVPCVASPTGVLHTTLSNTSPKKLFWALRLVMTRGAFLPVNSSDNFAMSSPPFRRS